MEIHELELVLSDDEIAVLFSLLLGAVTRDFTVCLSLNDAGRERAEEVARKVNEQVDIRAMLLRKKGFSKEKEKEEEL